MNPKMNIMKKLLFVAIVALFMACNSAPKEPLKVEGKWNFKEFVEGTAELNPQNQAMVNTIVNMFKDGSIEMAEGKVTLVSPSAGERSGTYTVEDGKLNVKFGENSQFALHVANENGNLIILFNEDGSKETGKIVMAK